MRLQACRGRVSLAEKPLWAAGGVMRAVATREGRAPFREYWAWYRVTGDLKATKAPVVALHGGPGAAHNYLEPYKLLADQGRVVVHYDQLGCGKTTLLPEKGWRLSSKIAREGQSMITRITKRAAVLGLLSLAGLPSKLAPAQDAAIKIGTEGNYAAFSCYSAAWKSTCV